MAMLLASEPPAMDAYRVMGSPWARRCFKVSGPEQDSNNPIRALRWKAQQALAKATGGAA